MCSVTISVEPLLNGGSGTITENDNGDALVTPSDEEYDGDGWGSRRTGNRNVWDDDDQFNDDQYGY